MTHTRVLAELERIGTAHTCRVDARHGAQQPMFGVRAASAGRVALCLLFVAMIALALTPAQTSHAAPLRDGKRFDPGARLVAPAEGAPVELGRLMFLLGDWDVTYTTFDADNNAIESVASSQITLLNRGHGFLERLHAADFDGQGNELNTVSFVVYSPADELWNVGTANSHTENIAVYHGSIADERLVLRNAIRRNGGIVLTHYRVSFGLSDRTSFEVKEETSQDDGTSWRTVSLRTYTRRDKSENFMATDEGYGSSAPELPEEAGQFDFLIGEWSDVHNMTFPNGQKVTFPANSTAVHCMNGHGVMEFSWYDVDPNLPDAATTIVRVYNRAMRRWESMYTTNRFSNILYFGGVKENDRIVLHNFEANTGDPNLSYYIFHDIRKDSYSWHAESSRDRGKTWKTTWTIDVTRK